MIRVRRHVEVENDILELAEWISTDNPAAAIRFLDSVESTITNLGIFPGKGSPKLFRVTGVSDLRSWAVRGFPNHLILYDLRFDGVYVLAVVHGSRQYSKILRARNAPP